MAKFRKLAVTIEAVAVTEIMAAHGTPMDDLPDWTVKAVMEHEIAIDNEGISVKTLEGLMRGLPGDMLIKGVKGELYPIKPDIFAATYEPAPEDDGEAVEPDGEGGEGEGNGEPGASGDDAGEGGAASDQGGEGTSTETASAA